MAASASRPSLPGEAERIEAAEEQMAAYIADLTAAGGSAVGILPSDPAIAARVMAHVNRIRADRQRRS